MDARDRHVALDYGHLAMHIAAICAVVLMGVLVIWLIIAPVKAVPFDADGVRCFARALTMDCIQTVPHP
jgi:uncharacterized membrane protein YkgB